MEKTERIVLIYVGRVRLVGKRSLGHSYIKEGTHEEMNFASKLKPTAIGWRIECTLAETGVRGPYDVLDRIEDEDLIDTWYNRDKALSDQQRLLKQSNKDVDTNYDRHIEALREMIRQQPSTLKRIFKMRIIYDIMDY